MQSGVTDQQLEADFIASDEFFRQADGPELATQRISDDYLQYLGRPADAAGVDYWINQFQHGKTNEDLITGFLATDEYFGKHP
ncbi:MAG: DUF4214 domain-containing protein [Candidatus Saccharimonadales bacterium]